MVSNMDKEIYGVNEALVLFKEGIKLKDNLSRIFFLKNKRIYVYSSSSSYSLTINEFLELYKDNKFIVYLDDDGEIDAKKDEEYYGFKHK